MKKRDEEEAVTVEAKNISKSMMLVMLLEECNFSCPHCIRKDEPMYPGYKLSFEQMKLCLSDCHRLQSIQRVHFSGGEPTIWREGNLDLMDLLIAISNAGFEPGITTNGSHFVDYERCHRFFERYFSGSSKTLHIHLSIDTFHRNFDVEKGRAESLDNIIKYKKDMPPEKGDLLNVEASAVISKDPSSLLPEEMIEHYESLGVGFGFGPLRSWGKATESIRHLCPNLRSDKPEDLGAYYRFHQREKQKKGDTKVNMVLIDNDYYFSNSPRKAFQLGNLPETIVNAYSHENRD